MPIRPQSESRGDRMTDPVSYTAAVIAGGFLVVLAGCLSLLMSDVMLLRSPAWWAWVALSSGLMAACVIGYFCPRSRVNYLPLSIAGVVLLGCCAMAAQRYLGEGNGVNPVAGLLRTLFCFGLWISWLISTIRRMRATRRQAG